MNKLFFIKQINYTDMKIPGNYDTLIIEIYSCNKQIFTKNNSLKFTLISDKCYILFNPNQLKNNKPITNISYSFLHFSFKSTI